MSNFVYYVNKATQEYGKIKNPSSWQKTQLEKQGYTECSIGEYNAMKSRQIDENIFGGG